MYSNLENSSDDENDGASGESEVEEALDLNDIPLISLDLSELPLISQELTIINIMTYL